MATQTCGHLYAGTASRARCVGGQDHCGQLYGRGPPARQGQRTGAEPNGRRGLTHDVLVSERRLRHQGAVPPRAATCRPFGGASQRAPVLPTTSCGRAAAYRATGLRAAGRKRWCRRGARTARPAAGRRGREARQRGGEIVGQPARGLPAVSRPAPPARREPAARPGRPATLPPSCRRQHTGCGPAGPPRCRTCARGSHTTGRASWTPCTRARKTAATGPPGAWFGSHPRATKRRLLLCAGPRAIVTLRSSWRLREVVGEPIRGSVA